jgi:hypothetical protein
MTRAFHGTLVALIATACCAAAMAQAAAKDVRHIKVVSVDGDSVVVWDQFGAQRYTVSEDFRFTVDDKQLAAAELKPGMEGTADVANATAVKAVHITEINMGKVVSQVGRSITVKDENGQVHRFTQSEADERGVRFYVDDKPTGISGLEPGDELSVTIVSEQPPEILTAGDVAASIEGSDEAPATTAAAEPATPAATPAAGAAEDEMATATDEETLWLWVLVVLVIAAVLWLVLRKKPTTTVVKKPTTTVVK